MVLVQIGKWVEVIFVVFLICMRTLWVFSHWAKLSCYGPGMNYKTSSTHFFMVFQFVPEPWIFPYKVKLNFHGLGTNWKTSWNYFHGFSICTRTLWVFAYWAKLSFHGSDTNYKTSSTHFSWFFNLYQNHEFLAWLSKEIFMVQVQIEKP